MKYQIIKPEDQAIGQFDGGKIKEQKPIGFPGEDSVIERLGPLFYWAWAKSSEPAEIGLHPHQGYEIITYVIKGKAYHTDTLGTESVVGEGGAQVMQTGSGVSHAEATNEPSETFQIWFEPRLSQAIKRKPTYSQFESSDFPEVNENGVSIKTILGNDAPIEIVADAKMWDVNIPKGKTYTHTLPANRTLAGLVIRGEGSLILDTNDTSHFNHKDFFIVQSEKISEVVIRTLEKDLRVFFIEVPIEVDYPLYRKSR
ncbi:pirin [Oceanobacillus piezotolerans]|uniref:Pirin n=1 Tax=Oceanobacillus piezotolerans TaxID=2448030 RepID=A0A498D1Y6_9BACI|nr:pirin family protein [Oceanobacillus piezotolerans]RLL40133.1 pirin [Oceanobacillus piezotolerans]